MKGDMNDIMKQAQQMQADLRRRRKRLPRPRLPVNPGPAL